jgi:hypothetical protein
MNDSKYKVVTSYSTRLNESLSSSRANSMVWRLESGSTMRISAWSR